MNPEPYLLGYLSAAVLVIGAAVCINSRQIYLQEQQMAVGKAEVLAAIAAEREEVLEAIREAQESQDLSDLLVAVQGIYEKNPVEVPENPDLEVVAEPVTDETGEVIGGIVHDEPETSGESDETTEG